MSDINTTNHDINPRGTLYKYDPDVEQDIYNFIQWGYENFNHPCLIHFKASVKPEQLKLDNLLKYLNRKLDTVYKTNAKTRGSKVIHGKPKVKWYWSLECGTSSGLPSLYQRTDGLFLKVKEHFHLHLYAMINVEPKKYKLFSIPNYVMSIMNEVDGLFNAKFLPRLNGEIYHDLKLELKDAKERMRYLAKTEQKQAPELRETFKKTRGRSRLD